MRSTRTAARAARASTRHPRARRRSGRRQTTRGRKTSAFQEEWRIGRSGRWRRAPAAANLVQVHDRGPVGRALPGSYSPSARGRHQPAESAVRKAKTARCSPPAASRAAFAKSARLGRLGEREALRHRGAAAARRVEPRRPRARAAGRRCSATTALARQLAALLAELQAARAANEAVALDERARQMLAIVGRLPAAAAAARFGPAPADDGAVDWAAFAAATDYRRGAAPASTRRIPRPRSLHRVSSDSKRTQFFSSGKHHGPSNLICSSGIFLARLDDIERLMSGGPGPNCGSKLLSPQPTQPARLQMYRRVARPNSSRQSVDAIPQS